MHQLLVSAPALPSPKKKALAARIFKPFLLWSQHFQLLESNRRKSLVQVFLWISTITILLSNTVEFLQGLPVDWVVVTAVLSASMVGLYVNHKGRTTLAAFILLLSVSALLLLEIMRLGFEQGTYIYLICLMSIVPFVADFNKKGQFLAMMSIPFSCIVLLLFYPFPGEVPLSAEEKWLGFRTNFLLFTLVTVAFIYTIAFVGRYFQRKLSAVAVRLEAVLEQTSYLIWSIDPDYKLVHANSNFLDSLAIHAGKPLQIGESVINILTSAETAFWLDRYAAGFRGERQQFDYHATYAGAEVISEIVLYPVYGPDGQIRWVSCYANDVTQARHNQRELEKKKAALEDTIELSSIGTWQYESGSDLLHWDARTAQIMERGTAGLSIDFKSFINSIHPDDQAAVAATFKNLAEQGGTYQLEYRITCPDHQVKYIFERARAVLDESGRTTTVQGFTQDLTAWRLDALANAQTKQLLEEVQGATALLLATAEADADVLAAVRRVAKAIEAGFAWIYQHEEIDGQAGARLLTPDLVGPGLDEALKAHLTAGTTYAAAGLSSWYERLRCGESIAGHANDHSQHPYLSQFNLQQYLVLPIFVHDAFWGFIGFDGVSPHRSRSANDEHILKGFCNSIGAFIRLQQYHRSLEDARKLAEQATQTKSHFLSNISHEIRTPMNAIMGFTDLLLTEPSRQASREYLQSIRYSSENLLRLINDLLDLSKVEANKLVLDPRDFELRPLLNEYEKMLRFLLGDKAVQLSLRVDPRLPDQLHGDSVRLNQILLNLGSNAVKFTQSGTIAIALEQRTAEATALELVITISDTGIGIQPEKKQLIFESFEQGDLSIAQKYGGTGLGLSITKRLVELMGGSIAVQSEVDRGTTFTVVLPLLKAEKLATKAGAPAGDEQYDLSGLHVLVVEDNRMNALLVSRLLESWRASSMLAENGSEALVLLESQRFDIVLLDLQMPVMDGFALLEILRSPDFKTPFAGPIIALTADAYDQTRDKALALGCCDFVTKPIEAVTLYDVIKTQLQLGTKQLT